MQSDSELSIDFTQYASFSPFFLKNNNLAAANIKQSSALYRNEKKVASVNIKKLTTELNKHLSEYIEQAKQPTTWLDKLKNLSYKKSTHVNMAQSLITSLQKDLKILDKHQEIFNDLGCSTDGDYQAFRQLQNIIKTLIIANTKLNQEYNFLGESKLKQIVSNALNSALALDNQIKIARGAPISSQPTISETSATNAKENSNESEKTVETKHAIKIDAQTDINNKELSTPHNQELSKPNFCSSRSSSLTLSGYEFRKQQVRFTHLSGTYPIDDHSFELNSMLCRFDLPGLASKTQRTL